MIRTVASSLRRGAVAAAQGEQRRLAGRHPPLPLLQRPASSPLPCRGFHVSGPVLRPAAVPPPPSGVPSMSAMALTTAEHSRMYTTSKSPVEEKKTSLFQHLLDDEVTAAAKRKEEEEETKEKREEKESAKKEALAADMTAKADELFADIKRQIASGEVKDQDALLLATLLAKSARDGQEIEKLKEKLESMRSCQALSAIGYLLLAILVFVK